MKDYLIIRIKELLRVMGAALMMAMLFMALPFNSVAVMADNGTALEADSIFIKGASAYGYSKLSDKQKEYYDEIDSAAVNFMNSSEDVEVDEEGNYYIIAQIFYAYRGLTMNEAFEAFRAYDYDHPAYYWISNSVPYGDGMLCLATCEEFALATDRAGINSKIDSGIKEYVKLAEQGKDTLDSIAIVHDKIIASVDYAREEDGTPQRKKWAHSPVGVFDDHKKVVCEGYADTFAAIMNYMGIPNYYITGMAGTGQPEEREGHAWNAVSDDNGATFFYMDLTWDDQGGGNGYYYKYFGAPKSDFEKSHFKYTSSSERTVENVARWSYDLDGEFCDSFDKTYYYRSGLFYSDSDGSATESFINHAKALTYRLGDRMICLTSGRSDLEKITTALGLSTYSGYNISYNDTAYLSGFFAANSALSLNNATVTLSADSFSYTGKPITPKPAVTLNGVKLLEGENYDLSYTKNTALNSVATVTVTGKGNFSGSKTLNFTIEPISLSSATINVVVPSYVYNGNEKEPSVIVSLGGERIKSSNYDVSYSNNIEPGTATVTVTGKGNYKDSASATFEIKRKPHGSKEAAGSAKPNAEGTVDISSYLESEPTVIMGSITDADGVLDGTPVYNAASKILTYKFKSTAAKDKKATVVLTLSSKYYAEYDLTVYLTVAEPDPAPAPAPTPNITPAPAPTPTPANLLSTVEAKKLKFKKSSLKINAGDKISLIVTATPSNSYYAYSISGSAATLDPLTGEITGVSTGKVKVTITSLSGKKKAKCTITVKGPVAVKSLKLSKSSLKHAPGASKVITATPNPKNAKIGTDISWNLDRPDIVSITPSGNSVEITAISPGKATITAISGNGKKKKCKVTVK